MPVSNGLADPVIQRSVDQLTVLVPDPEAVDANVALLHEGHAQADQSGSLLGHVDPVGGENRLSVQRELVVRLRESGDESGESGAHAAEDELVSDLFEELGGVAAALFDELDDFEVSRTFGGAFLVHGGAGVHAHVGFADLLDDQSPEKVLNYEQDEQYQGGKQDQRDYKITF